MTINAGSENGQGAGSATDDGIEESGTPQTVSYESHKRLLDQRKADQARLREAQSALEAANAEKAEAERARLAEQQQYKQLYENEKKRAADLESNLKNMTTSQIERTKRDAVRAAIGSIRKDDYLKFADLSSVHLNEDGSVDAESVKAVANKFRETYPELIEAKPGKMAQEAASGFEKPAAKSPNEMTPEELRAEFRKVSKVK